MVDTGAGCVLRTTAGVADETGYWSLPLRGHHQGRERQLGAHVVAHRPSDDLAGRQVEHRGHGCTDGPSPAGRHASSATRIVPDGAPAGSPRRRAVSGSPSSDRSVRTAPIVIAAARHTEHAAHDVHRPGGRVLLDKGELHRGISARPVLSEIERMPTAFFRMSRFIHVRSSSRRNRAIPDRLIRWRGHCRYRRGIAHLQLTLPATQHRRHDPQLGCHPGLHLTARLSRGWRVALELVREPTLRRTRHHPPPGSAEPITGTRQTLGSNI